MEQATTTQSTRLRRALPLIIALALALLLAVAVKSSPGRLIILPQGMDGVDVNKLDTPERELTPSEYTEPDWTVVPEDRFARMVIDTIANSVIPLLVLIALVVAIWVIRRILRSARPHGYSRIPTEEDDELTTEQARDSLTRARSLLDAPDGDVRAAIVAAWLELEGSFARAGVKRDQVDTSSDVVHAALARFPVGAGDLEGLAALYREAQFSRHEVPASRADEARERLERLLASLATVGSAHGRTPVGADSGASQARTIRRRAR